MKRHVLTVLVILMALAVGLLAGCASGPRMVRAEQELKAGPDAALIVFLRPNPLSFGGGGFQLWDREKFIGLIDPVTSVSYRAKPGEHMFLMRAENWEIVKGKVAAGKTYYILIEPRVGIGIYSSGTRVSVTVLDPQDKRIKEWMPRLRPLQLDDPGSAEAVEKKYEKHVKKAIGTVEAGKLNFTSISPNQGK